MNFTHSHHSHANTPIHPLIHRHLILVLILALLGLSWLGSGPVANAASNDAVSAAYWQGEYFNNPTLAGPPALRNTARAIVYNWRYGSPNRRIQSDHFSARWTRRIYFAPGLYRLRIIADDGARVYVDDQLVLDAWSDGPARATDVDVSLSGTRIVRVEYYERVQLASVSFSYGRIGAAQAQTAWRGEYYNNTTLTGAPTLVRNDAQISFNWNTASPDPRIRADEFSARWTRRLNAPQGNYTINVWVDDGVRVYVDGNLVIDQWQDGQPRGFQATVFMRNQSSIRVEYFDRTGGAQIQVVIVPGDGPAPTAQPLPPPPPNGYYPQWRGEYYTNPDLAGSPVLVRNDLTIDFTWGAGSPDGRVPVDNFSARWTGVPKLTPGFYRINVNVDDGVRVYVNNQIVIDGWADGNLRSYSANITVGNSFPQMRVEYYDRTGHAQIQVSFTPISDPNQPTSFPDWKGEYFNNISVDGTPALLRNDSSINFDWTGTSPDPRIRTTDFSVRWSRRLNFAGGVYRFDITADDAMRVWIDGNLVLNEWYDGGTRDRSVQLGVSAGDHDLRVDYYQRGGGAIARFNIVKLDPTPTVLPTSTPTSIPPTPPPATLTPLPIAATITPIP